MLSSAPSEFTLHVQVAFTDLEQDDNSEVDPTYYYMPNYGVATRSRKPSEINHAVNENRVNNSPSFLGLFSCIQSDLPSCLNESQNTSNRRNSVPSSTTDDEDIDTRKTTLGKNHNPRRESSSAFETTPYTALSSTRDSQSPSTVNSYRNEGNSFTQLSTSSRSYRSDDIITFASKKANWNREFRQYSLPLGGRVKVPSSKNFLVTDTPCDSSGKEAVVQYNTAVEDEDHTSGCSNPGVQNDRICIRHGKVNVNYSIL